MESETGRQAYTIKPLEWKRVTKIRVETHTADAWHLTLCVDRPGNDHWFWSAVKEDDSIYYGNGYATEAEAKAAAEAYWASLLGEWLVRVEAGK